MASSVTSEGRRNSQSSNASATSSTHSICVNITMLAVAPPLTKVMVLAPDATHCNHGYEMPKAAELPEIREEDAPDRIRIIYDDIRHWTGVPMVALIFRNLATHSGLLEEIWESVAPLFRNGLIQETAWRIASTAKTADLPPIEANARAVLGLTGGALTQVCNATEAYNRANPVNLLTMLALMTRLKDPASASPAPVRKWTPPTAIPGPLPGMTSPEAMTPKLRWLINDLSFGDRSTLSPVVPSLYRHLTAWPGYLAVLHVTLMPRFRDGSLAHASQGVQQEMAREAASIATYLPPIRGFVANTVAINTVAQFATTTIPLMIVVGHAMQKTLA